LIRSAFLSAVSVMLAAVGVLPAAIDRERSQMSAIRFGPTRNR
jgi:hypothetical protein